MLGRFIRSMQKLISRVRCYILKKALLAGRKFVKGPDNNFGYFAMFAKSMICYVLGCLYLTFLHLTLTVSVRQNYRFYRMNAYWLITI